VAAVIRVLVVDDQTLVRRGIQSLLALSPEIGLAGEAESGAQALKLIASERPDVVLLDLKMPGMSAAHFVRLLKQQPGLSRIPIILTTAALDSDVPKDLAFDALLPRPFDVSRLLELVQHATSGGADKDPLQPR